MWDLERDTSNEENSKQSTIIALENKNEEAGETCLSAVSIKHVETDFENWICL